MNVLGALPMEGVWCTTGPARDIFEKRGKTARGLARVAETACVIVRLAALALGARQCARQRLAECIRSQELAALTEPSSQQAMFFLQLLDGEFASFSFRTARRPAHSSSCNFSW
jgi:hypothetical protein